jgi:hypothetical protein
MTGGPLDLAADGDAAKMSEAKDAQSARTAGSYCRLSVIAERWRKHP